MEFNENMLPEIVRSYLRGRKYRIDDIGRSGSSVLVFDDIVLKISESCAAADNEYAVMRELSNTTGLRIPNAIAFEKKEGKSYLIMTRLCGSMSCSDKNIAEPEKTVRALARGLKVLQNVDISEKKLIDADASDLANARENAADKIIEFENEKYSAREVIEYLEKNKPCAEDGYVLSHGDYCMPNVFVTDGNVTGFIDLGGMGAASKWRDICMCLWSMRYNFGELRGADDETLERYEEIFIEELGYRPDEEKLRYYRLFGKLF